MEFYIPSLLVLIAAFFIIVVVFPKLTPLALAVIAMVALVAGAYNHYTLFGQEYQLMTWIDGARAAAPYVLVGTVTVFIVGYLLFLFGTGRKLEMPAMPMLPPAETATNPATEMINNALVNTGLVNRNGNGRPNGRPPNLVSKNDGVTNTQIQNILRSRLNKQV